MTCPIPDEESSGQLQYVGIRYKVGTKSATKVRKDIGKVKLVRSQR